MASIFLCLGALVFSKLLSSRNSNRAIARSPGDMNPGVHVEVEGGREGGGERGREGIGEGRVGVGV